MKPYTRGHPIHGKISKSIYLPTYTYIGIHVRVKNFEERKKKLKISRPKGITGRPKDLERMEEKRHCTITTKQTESQDTEVPVTRLMM